MGDLRELPRSRRPPRSRTWEAYGLSRNPLRTRFRDLRQAANHAEIEGGEGGTAGLHALHQRATCGHGPTTRDLAGGTRGKPGNRSRTGQEVRGAVPGNPPGHGAGAGGERRGKWKSHLRRVRLDLEDVARRDHLAEAAFLAARGKRHRPEVREFLDDLEGRISELRNEILNGTVRVGEGHRFEIRDPKPRAIF